ncbi:MAG TPA: S-layer homology domain-containing protein [Clostridiales bacterium]|nr:S-layer homology domain-containing protein [Clostridiales bacterium]
MFKKFLSLTLALVMALGLVAGAVDYKDADDISDYAEDAVQTVHDLNIMQGDNHGNFNPKEPITREQMFRVMYAVHNAGDINVNPIYASLLTSSYKDADQVATWARAFAGYNVSKQIFKGDGAGMLRPKASISYQEVAVLFLRALGYKDDYITGYNPLFNWGQNALLLAHEAGITKGLPSISNPAAAATREDVAVMAENAINAVTVRFDKDANVYIPVTTGEGIVTLGDAKYGVTDAVKGTVVEYAKDGKSYKVAKSISDMNTPESLVTYTLKGETLDPSLVGKTIRWTYRNGNTDDRINNLAVVADEKLFEDVRLDKLSGKVKDDDVILTIDGTEVKIAISEFGIYYAGNGALTLKEEDSILGDGDVAAFLEEAFPFKDAKTVDIAINDGKLIIRGWLTDSYLVDSTSLPTYALGKIAEVKGDYVVIDVLSGTNISESKTKLVYIADELNGAAKDDRVLFEVNYADALLGKNDDAKEGAKDLGDKIYSGAELLANATIVEVLEPIAVKGDKIVELSNGTYRMDGKEVAPAAMAAVDFDIDDYVAVPKDDTNNPVVFMSDKYIYDGADATPQSDDDTVEYFYGLFVEQYFVPSGDNAGAYIKVLGTDGDTHTLKVAKIFDEDEEEFVKVSRTDKPIAFDAVGAPVFGIKQVFYDEAAEKDLQDKFVGYAISFSRNDDGTYNVIVVEKTDTLYVEAEKLDNNSGEALTTSGMKVLKASTATGRKIENTDLYYNANSVFFVRYKPVTVEGGTVVGYEKVAVVKGSEIVDDQAIKNISYVASTAGILKTVTVAVVEVDATSLTMITAPASTSGTTMLLTANPTWTTYSDRVEFVLKGIVDGEVKELTFTTKGLHADLNVLKVFDAVQIQIEDGVVKSVKSSKKEAPNKIELGDILGTGAILDKKVEGFEDGIIKVAENSPLDVSSSAKIFYYKKVTGGLEYMNSGDLSKDTWNAYIGIDKGVAVTIIFVKQ